MIRLPSNWIRHVRVREYPHNPKAATLMVFVQNEHKQGLGLYQHLLSVHGDRPADHLEDGLATMRKTDLELMLPHPPGQYFSRSEALDQDWSFIDAPNTLNLKEYRAKYNLRDPEERANAFHS